MKQFTFSVLFILLGLSVFGQEKKDDFKITGSPIVTVYTNYHAGLGESNGISGFEITRAYLGYQAQLLPSLSAKIVVDAGVSPAESLMAAQKREVYLKNAQLTWKEQNLTINGGLTGLLQFNVQEKFWGHRYIAQSFQDLYKMGSSADLGVTAEYQFIPQLSADFSFTNGEGYKNINTDNKYRTGLGITIKPIPSLTIRAYGDIFQQSLAEKTNPDTYKTQQTLALFGGYKCKYFSLGAEYNYQKNSAWKDRNNYYGYSVYTTVPINKKWHVFGRYDNIDSDDKDSNKWISFTGDLVIVGVEFSPIKNIKISPNYKFVKDYDTKLLAHNNSNWAYLNVEFTW